MQIFVVPMAVAVLLAQQQDSVASSLRWLVPTGRVDAGEPMPAWLRLSLAPPETLSVRIDLVAPEANGHGFGACGGDVGPTWTGLVHGDTVLATCVATTPDADFRLLAAGRATGPAESWTAASGLIEIRPNPLWPPGPMAMAVIAAVLGFVGGLATQLTTSAIRVEAEARTARTAAHKQAIAHLLPEMRANRRLLDDYLMDPAGQPAPDLVKTEFEKFSKAGGVGDLLSVDGRRPTLGPVRYVYENEMVEYERAKNQGRDTVAPAKKVVQALDPYTS